MIPGIKFREPEPSLMTQERTSRAVITWLPQGNSDVEIMPRRCARACAVRRWVKQQGAGSDNCSVA